MNATADLLRASHDLYVRNGGIGGDKETRPKVYKIVGLILAISSGLFIGVSFVIKKVGLLKANAKYNEEAGEGYGYLKNAWWWLGMTLMIIGEICNFVAYAFVDAILVTPLGALSVVVTTILSAIFLKERLSFVGKVGCFNCIIGSVVIVINAPEQSSVTDIQDMKKLVISPGFLSYAGVVIIACAAVAIWVAPKYGKKSMMVYISICSLIGGLSVVATQGLGAAIVAQIAGKSQFKEWFLYILLVFVITTLLTEIIYLNKALNLFNAALVTPTYYVLFTTSTIITSAILFRGFKGTPATISTVIMGFFQICAGVVLLQLSKSAKDVPDTAVFTGDLDQVRTVAEQAEPEYEPRADTIRGGGAILRSISKARTEKQAMEARKLAEEHMQPIGEGEQVEFDGIRRRRTVMDPGRLSRSGTMAGNKTLHPPLGMTHFPSHDDSDDDTSYHPGFFQRLRSRGKSTATPPPNAVGMSTLSRANTDGTTDDSDRISNHSYKQKMPVDTSYKPHDTHDTHINFAPLPIPSSHDSLRSNDSLHPPRPPPHIAKRQFSFQNVFSRNRGDSTGAGSEHSRPASRHSRKTSHANATEEERLGLVSGDSQTLLPIPSRDSEDGLAPSPQRLGDWEMPRLTSPIASPERRPSPPAHGGALRRVDTEETLSEYEKDAEKRGGSASSGAFL